MKYRICWKMKDGSREGHGNWQWSRGFAQTCMKDLAKKYSDRTYRIEWSEEDAQKVAAQVEEDRRKIIWCRMNQDGLFDLAQLKLWDNYDALKRIEAIVEEYGK
jgi:hypothetical protein